MNEWGCDAMREPLVRWAVALTGSWCWTGLGRTTVITTVANVGKD